MAMIARVRFASFLIPITMSLFACDAALAQVRSEEFHSKVVSLYNFHPLTLTKEQVNAKSDELDAFWSQAKADPTHVLPLLRDELANPSDPDFFSYDGAKLLLSLSSDRADQILALAYFPKADLEDVDHTDYLVTIQAFASKGFDTRKAAFKVLAYPRFEAIIPAHALTLGQNYAMIYMLYPMEQSSFEQDLVRRLETEKDPLSQKSLLRAVWYLMTPAARAALKAFGEKPGIDTSVADYAHELLAITSGPIFSFSSAESLRSERMRVMRLPISDEALIDFDSLTIKLLSKI